MSHNRNTNADAAHAADAQTGAVRNKRAIARQATSRVAFESEPPGDDDPLLGFEPYRHARPRTNSITPDLQREFVAHLSATGIVTTAARRIGRSMEALYKLRQRPGAEGFASAWDKAAKAGVKRLEDAALARAIEGSQRHIVRGGEVIATERFHNEALVMFFLRHRLPERYGSGELKPGHPDYEALKADLRAEWDAEARAERQSPENREANLKFFEDLKARWHREWEAEQWARAAKARMLGQAEGEGDAGPDVCADHSHASRP